MVIRKCMVRISDRQKLFRLEISTRLSQFFQSISDRLFEVSHIDSFQIHTFSQFIIACLLMHMTLLKFILNNAL